MKKRILAVLVCLMMVALCACGSSGSSTPPANSTGTAPSAGGASTAPPAADEQVEITLTFWGSPAEKAAIEASCATFMEAYPHIKVNSMHIPNDDFLTKLNSMIAAGNAPDISYSAEWKCQMGKDGLIYNFYDLIDQDPEMSVDDYLETCWWNWSPTESAGPIMANVAPGLMYNADMFEELNVELPPTKVDEAWSWDEFVDVAKQLTLDVNGNNAHSPDFDPGNIKQYGVQFANTWISYMPFVLSNGGYYLNEDMTEFALDQPDAAEAIQRIADLINVHHVSPSAVQRSSMPAPATALQSKQIAMYVDGSWNHLDLAEAELNWGVGVLPIDENYTTFFDGGSLIIFKSTQHLDETWLLYKWITNPESSKEITDMFQSIWLPVHTKYYTDQAEIEFWASEDLPARPKGFQDAVVHATYENQVRPTEVNVINFNQIDTLVASALDQVWLGEKSAADALAEVKVNADPLVEGTYFGDRS